MINEYKSKKIENKITFSGSNLNNYFYNPKLFWDRVFDREVFSNTTSTCLGTIIHYCANKYLETGQVSKDIVNDYLLEQNDDVDKDFIINHYLDMGNALFDYLDKHNISNLQFKSEYALEKEVSKYGVLTGTIDLIYGDTLVDFKTTSKLSDISVLPMNYIRQLQAYYYLCRTNNIDIRNAKIVYITIPRVGEVSPNTGKPLKDYPCRIYEMPIDNGLLDMNVIDTYLKHIGECIDFIKENPQYEKLITRENIQ